jgi:hypothetical protein
MRAPRARRCPLQPARNAEQQKTEEHGHYRFGDCEL